MSDMHTWVAEFDTQLSDAEQISKQASLHKSEFDIHNVLIAGLGGSGIGATIVSELAKTNSTIPVFVNKDYFCPNFVSKHTLFIASSYSGNTEETLACAEEALRRGAKVVIITSGGKFEELAKQHNLDIILVPKGYQPRACLGYSLYQLITVLAFHNILPQSIMDDRADIPAFISENKENCKVQGEKIAQFLRNSIPVFYSESHLEGVTIRLRQQVNENSKMLCWHHVIPEMNHNELVGWANKTENIAVLFITDPDGYYRNKERTEYCIQEVSKYTSRILRWDAEGKTLLQKIFYLIHTGDWASMFLADMNKVDAMDIKVIDSLKMTLAGLK